MQIDTISALGPLPHLAMDILPMARVISVGSTTKIILITSQLLIVTGAMAVEFAVKRRHEIAQFAALLVMYSCPFALGLMNFEFGNAAFEAMLLDPSFPAVMAPYAAASLSWLLVQRVAQLGAAYSFTVRGFLFERLFSSPCGKVLTLRFVGAFHLIAVLLVMHA
jgi:hypothetical protein